MKVAIPTEFWVTLNREGLMYQSKNDLPAQTREERCSMQLVTVAECFTFFLSIAVIVYLWIQ
jgi:hypothetical protein